MKTLLLPVLLLFTSSCVSIGARPNQPAGFWAERQREVYGCQRIERSLAPIRHALGWCESEGYVILVCDTTRNEPVPMRFFSSGESCGTLSFDTEYFSDDEISYSDEYIAVGVKLVEIYRGFVLSGNAQNDIDEELFSELGKVGLSALRQLDEMSAPGKLARFRASFRIGEQILRVEFNEDGSDVVWGQVLQ